MWQLVKHRLPIAGVTGAVLFMIVQVIANLSLPKLTADIVNKGITNGDVDLIKQIGIQMIGVSLISIVAALGNVFLASRISQGLGRDLRNDVFSKVINYSNDEFDEVGTSSLITRTTNDVLQIQNVMMMILRMMIMAPITLIGASFLAYQRDHQLTKIFIYVIPILIVVIAVLMGSAVPLFKKMQKLTDRLNLVFREGLTGVRVIRAFRRDTFEQDRFDQANTNYTNNALRVFSILAVMFPMMTLIMSGTNVGITWMGANLIADQATQTGNMIAFMTYAMQILMSFLMLSMVFVFVPRAQAAAVRINEVLALKTKIVDPKKPEALATETTSLKLDHVNYRYRQAENLALTDINVSVKGGETLAIIGGTGSGKTTLVNLIPRFYDVETGEVSINGVNIKAINKETLRDQVALVPQKALLFKGTLRENMKYGNETATDDAIWHALDIAQASDFIKETGKGLDTTVEQGGNNFSGGQKQRLAIARALVKEASIYVFDDSFSALDFKTDANLRQQLKDDPFMKDKVTVIVGQRVSTVASADAILVLDNGKMAGYGTHEALKQNSPVYQDIVASQIREGGAANA
ncbi:ABC transporter ATP-binding protein [Agrilactobacillus yilanensis]|uniref:ABC transporter ATP-binding protein n=1 Tax=Agrilactobacillus yilanensis TaxID=2485997 RepID=A0ABW4J6E3_9LACO|nr:ABC transporter ATP-binding protein [Agrilactobacillus yilanensis]